jgi:hypothetical protein
MPVWGTMASEHTAADLELLMLRSGGFYHCDIVMGLMRRIVTTPDAAQRLAESFEEAGLGAPSLVCERVVGTHQSRP